MVLVKLNKVCNEEYEIFHLVLYNPTIISHSGPPKLVVLQMDLAIHTYEEIMRITENLSEHYIIGYGASSTVYKCVLKNSRAIAIKRLYSQYPHNLREFETELETIGSIRHRNLVSLHGYSLSPHGNLLFYDYMQNGSLWDLLHGLLFNHPTLVPFPEYRIGYHSFFVYWQALRRRLSSIGTHA